MTKIHTLHFQLKKFQAKKASQSTGGSHSSSPVPAAAASSAAAPPTALGTYFSSAAVVGTPSHEDSSVFSSPIADPFSSIQGNSRQSAENPSYPQQQSHNVQPLPPLASSYFSTSPSAPPLPSSTEANSFSSSFGTAGSAFNALPPQSESFPINTSVAPEVSSESGATAQLPENSFAFSPAANASESSAAATFDPFTSSAQIPPAANVVVSSAAVPTTMDQLSAEISGVLNAKLDSLENEDVILERAKLAEAERKNAELEHQLEQHKTSLKQYEEYCQSLVSQFF